jgi:anti-sigma factor RsiW
MSSCDRVRDDLPFYVNGTLALAERAVLDEHLRGCRTCRDTLALEERLAGSMQTSGSRVVPSPHAAWQRLEPRLVEAAVPPAEAAVRRRSLRSRYFGRRALFVAVAAQAVALVFLAVALWRAQAPQPPTFQTLTTPDPTLASRMPLVRVAFAPLVDADEAQQLAASAGARVLAGPSPENVYTLSVEAGGMAAAIEKLRASPQVRLAEQVFTGSDP